MPKKIVLAYSGGLDTSVILKWLQLNYGCSVATYTADIGQNDNFDEIKNKSKNLGVKDICIEDLKEEFVKDYVFPMFRANALYEGVYLLGTAIARPLIARKQVEYANKIGADAVAHGSTGKGNDQVRFEIGYYSTNPDIEIIAPWRLWDLKSRESLIQFAKKYQITIPKDKIGEPPFSVDENVLHTSAEGKVLEDPWASPPNYVFSRTKNIEDTPERAEEIIISFENGDPIKINKRTLSPYKILAKLNDLGLEHGIGRVDMVENRFIGMKSRGVYETPGGTILYHAHRAIESITLDKETAHKKDLVIPEYAELIYNGFWFSKKRKQYQEIVDTYQGNVNGDVKLKLFKGNVIILGRKSENSLYDLSKVSFENNEQKDQQFAEEFIKSQFRKIN
ncbi:MAG: argininosuccinate synthase [Alphaproteobacteria bacterium]|jgi:argininosuccinate synthase|nr:argininosuccinate synthase [Alphaproteobacteria bacterium]|tara:strand:- start:2507 stop:3685 length:1179 start_codon:yes stop_codon:yes gene_type:complete